MKNKKETNNKFKNIREVLKESNYKKAYWKYTFFVALGSAVLYLSVQIFVGLLKMLSLSLEMPAEDFTNKFMFTLIILLWVGFWFSRHFFHRSLMWVDHGCGGLKHIWKLDTDKKYKAECNKESNLM